MSATTSTYQMSTHVSPRDTTLKQAAGINGGGRTSETRSLISAHGPPGHEHVQEGAADAGSEYSGIGPLGLCAIGFFWVSGGIYGNEAIRDVSTHAN